MTDQEKKFLSDILSYKLSNCSQTLTDHCWKKYSIMKKISFKYSILYAFILICLLHCKNPPREDSMQPYAGYPLLANPDSIKQKLASECLDTINFMNAQIIADIGAGNKSWRVCYLCSLTA